jgi:hypothetical protein
MKLVASVLVAVILGVAPAVATTTCLGSVQNYWAGLGSGNFTAAFQNVAPNVTLNWPGASPLRARARAARPRDARDPARILAGDASLLPMAGTWSGPGGIAGFFESVGSFFSFTFCPNGYPQFFATSSSTVYGFWLECSPFVGGTTVPCPNNRNQVLYTCDGNGLIDNIAVNLDNACVAAAVCEFQSGSGAHLQCIV